MAYADRPRPGGPGSDASAGAGAGAILTIAAAAAARRVRRARRPDVAQEILDKATRMLIHRVAKSNDASGRSYLAKTA
jgi:hypothetical protein